MVHDLKSAIVENMAAIKKEISEKTSDVARLKKEFDRYKAVLGLLPGNGHEKKSRSGAGKSGGRKRLRNVLTELPETFTSRDFVDAAAGAGKPAVYLRQTLARWAKEGKLKRVERGKYHKVKKNGNRAAA